MLDDQTMGLVYTNFSSICKYCVFLFSCKLKGYTVNIFQDTMQYKCINAGNINLTSLNFFPFADPMIYVTATTT